MHILGTQPRTSGSNQFSLGPTEQHMKLKKVIPFTEVTSIYAVWFFVDHCVIQHEAPTNQFTDTGPQLVSDFFKAVWKYLQVRLFMIAAYKCQSNDQVDHCYQMIVAWDCHYVDKHQIHWDPCA